jgi:catechol 2,3-dioxygenase-like lactoylglutathione lyase family enzyme
MNASFAQSVYHPQYIAADILFYFLFFDPILLLSLISAQYFAKALTMTSSIPPPKPIALVPELEVADFDRSMHFYVEVLGFVIQYGRPERPFAYLAFGDAHIMIEKGGGWMTGHLERPYGRGINFQIRVPEVKSVSERLAAAGWPVFQDIEDAWYRRGTEHFGARELVVQDPDGYLLRFSQDLGVR